MGVEGNVGFLKAAAGFAFGDDAACLVGGAEMGPVVSGGAGRTTLRAALRYTPVTRHGERRRRPETFK